MHKLTTKQLRILARALSTVPPELTDDPVINYCVDCIMGEEVDYDQNLYEEEVKAAKEAGLL